MISLGLTVWPNKRLGPPAPPPVDNTLLLESGDTLLDESGQALIVD